MTAWAAEVISISLQIDCLFKVHPLKKLSDTLALDFFSGSTKKLK